MHFGRAVVEARVCALEKRGSLSHDVLGALTGALVRMHAKWANLSVNLRTILSNSANSQSYGAFGAVLQAEALDEETSNPLEPLHLIQVLCGHCDSSFLLNRVASQLLLTLEDSPNGTVSHLSVYETNATQRSALQVYCHRLVSGIV
jgi:hypothetical protein